MVYGMRNSQDKPQDINISTLGRIFFEEAVFCELYAAIFKRIWILLWPNVLKALFYDRTTVLDLESQVRIRPAQLKRKASHTTADIYN